MTIKTLPGIRLASRPDGLHFQLSNDAKARYIKLKHADEPAAGEIEVLGEIGPAWSDDFITASMVKKQLKGFAKDASIEVTINSMGGDVFDGIAIYNLLREHKGTVAVRVIGMAASAASVVAMAGDTVKVSQAAQIMIHSAWAVIAGNQDELREYADVLDNIDQAIAGLYAARTGLPKDEVLEMMKAETWMDADESVRLGFADDEETETENSARANLPALLAASGQQQGAAARMSANSPGATGKGKGNNVMNVAENIAAHEAKRAAHVERMNALMTLAASEGRTLEANESEEYDTLDGEVETIDGHLVRLRAMEKRLISGATPAPGADGIDPAHAASVARTPVQAASVPAVRVTQNVPKAIGMARYAMAQIQSGGNLNDALSIIRGNKRWMDQTPELERVMMAAVVAGDTTTSGWASQLVYNENLAAEFIEFLRPMTIVGRISNLRRVPFNVRMGEMSGSGTAYWVGQGAPVPMSKATVTSQTLGIAKMAGLMAIDEELARSSSPSAELLVRDDLAKLISTFLDVQFVDPNVSTVSNVNPASITNGVTPVSPTGTALSHLRADIQTLINQWTVNDLDVMGGIWITTPKIALAISEMENALGQKQFPGVTLMGGEFFGLPMIVSNSANIPGSPDSGHMIILANAPEIFFADDGQVTISVSTEASIQMLDNPTVSSTTPTPTTSVSMFQTSSLAIKAVRYVNWSKRRTFAVSYIKEAAYVA